MFTLQDKKEEIDLQSDSKSDRSLEIVRNEEEDVLNKLRISRRNLESCQETLHRHNVKINDLEAKQDPVLFEMRNNQQTKWQWEFLIVRQRLDRSRQRQSSREARAVCP